MTRTHLLIISIPVVVTLTIISYAVIVPSNVTIHIQEGSNVPGCEETNTCLSDHNVTIQNGGRVTWINNDNAAHTITSGMLSNGGPDGNFDSGLFGPNSQFTHTFRSAGEYPYFCLVHPWTTGTITVI